MVKKYILILILFVYSGLLSAQCYLLDTVKVINPIDCREAEFKLNLLDGYFYIVYSDSYIEGMESVVFSYGRFKVRGNKYYLQDTPSNMVLECNRNNAVFEIEKGFSFMQGHKFTYLGDCDEIEVSIVSPHIKNNKKSDLYKLKNRSDCMSIPLKLGVYENGAVSLYLEYDFQFSIRLEVQKYEWVISDGFWCKNGNNLELYDRFADHRFTALIDSLGINAIDFPRELGTGYRFRKAEGKMLPFIVR